MKVWIYKGEVIASRTEREAAALAQVQAAKAERAPKRAPRAPKGEVTKTSVAERANEAAAAVESEVSPEVKSEGSDA